MDMKWVILLLFVINYPYLHLAVETDYAFAKLSTTWINNDFIARGRTNFADVQAISDSTFVTTVLPQVLWTANRANPVKENATLQFTKEGDLVLTDANGTFVWSSNTSNSSITINQMNVSGNGTLQLVNLDEFNSYSDIVWQSWDLPADTWLPGQILQSGLHKLTSSISISNLAPGSFFLSIEKDNLYAFIDSNPPQMYHQIFQQGSETKQFKTGSLKILTSVDEISINFESDTEDFQYLRLDPDGHLRVYQWIQGSVSIVDDILTDNLGNCSYPTVCGNYGICSNGGSCSCPVGKDGDNRYFTKLNSSLGCMEADQLSCRSSHLHSLIELDEVSYFSFIPALSSTDIESCKRACLKNCSCKAALFRYHFSNSSGNCSLPSQIFSLMGTPQGLFSYNSTAFIKVQRSLVAQRPPSSAPSPPFIAPSPNDSMPEPPRKKSRIIMIILISVLVSTTMAVFLIRLCIRYIKQSSTEERSENNVDRDWENSLLQVTNLPKRFTYQDLKSATENFNKKLGGGGFGSVFEGSLSDGTKVAVKRLDRFGQGRKEFLAEVKTIGSIHHVNLVRLVGFCAENSHKLLVYEHMSNGSLDKWIFNRNPENTLEWKIRKNIILNIAKGLSYLHEECKMRIAHLDIKPQNILLDDKFDAKLSDFGLARLIDRNQSHVITQMRGTRGYMAPEWLSRKITEKVDVYSFGVVILEIICGRKNLDLTQPEEDDYLLLPIVKQKAEQNQLIDLVDKCTNMQQCIEEAVEMIRIAIWCLHNDPTKRPSMSIVVKVLEGVKTMEPVSDYGFLTSTVVEAPAEVVVIHSEPQSASILSGPR
ncbi:G-type lectin S-receptor-like serine/threonine-protein kinase SD2-5 isoform X2 [Hevea brasiliensis]|uniref:G-type lectin S-receptor-like serine/threonine-protein kinase SD2-5 isoform X2 n=1 Tax=Hevea brasiliensis TaxID=3981 RepID=UPI0025D5E506|nr:G-type lectin S-receptor-like serine/threonine-protein kinase SD2-5 isoform X2 [Hevea brasiliensis]